MSVHYVDDIDGSADAGPVDFSLDGKKYTIDLSDANTARLREVLAPFVSAARRPGGRLVDQVAMAVHAQVAARAEAVSRPKRCGAGFATTDTRSRHAAAFRPNWSLRTRCAHQRRLYLIVRQH